MKSNFQILIILIFFSSLSLAGDLTLEGKSSSKLSAIFESQKASNLSRLGKHCALSSQSEFELKQNQITDPDLKMSDESFIQYISENAIPYANEYASLPNPSLDSCFMSKNELFALKVYTGSFYRVLNTALREHDKTSLLKYRILIKYVQSALSKFKPYEGYVKRGTNLTQPALEQHKVSQSLTYLAFTSTSVGGGFAGNVNYVILSHDCKYIAPFSKFTSEEEVLCGPGSTFKIYYREDSSGTTKLVMEQVPSHFDVDEFLTSLQ